MIQRWECEEYEYGRGYMRAYDHRMQKDPDGDYVLYADHEQEVDTWVKACAEWERKCSIMDKKWNKVRHELGALRESDKRLKETLAYIEENGYYIGGAEVKKIKRLREALDRIESLSTIETVEISKIAREALKEG